MKVLVLASGTPATSSMPGSPRLFNLCRELSARHRLTLVTVGGSERRLETFLADPTTTGVFDKVISLPSEPDGSGWLNRQIHRVRNQPSFVTRFRNPGFHKAQCARLQAAHRDGAFDVVFVDGIWAAQYVEGTRLESPAIIDLHDSMALLSVRSRKRVPYGWRRFKLLFDTRCIARYEAALGRTFRTVITNSPVDEAFLRKLNPATRTLTIGNGVDSRFFSPGPENPDSSRLVFTGVMDYPPNEEAAIDFADRILPLVQARHPEVEFWIVGKDPTARVRELEHRRGIHVTGSVPDVRPFVHSAAVFVSPLRNGTGIKNKLLAALSMSKAAVATSVTVEGLDLRDGTDLLVADKPEDFAESVNRLLDDRSYGSRLASSGCAFVREHYSWSSSAATLERTLLDAIPGDS